MSGPIVNVSGPIRKRQSDDVPMTNQFNAISVEEVLDTDSDYGVMESP